MLTRGYCQKYVALASRESVVARHEEVLAKDRSEVSVDYKNATVNTTDRVGFYTKRGPATDQELYSSGDKTGRGSREVTDKEGVRSASVGAALVTRFELADLQSLGFTVQREGPRSARGPPPARPRDALGKKRP